MKDRLFDLIPGREHPSFPRFRNSVSIKSPEKLQKRFEKYARVLDAEAFVLED